MVDGEESEPAGSTDGLSVSSLVFLLGLLAFLASAAAFAVDLATGFDVARSLAVNGAAALMLVAWAARDTLADPESDVRTLPGAAGTALLLLGGYLVVAAAVVAATSLLHGRLDLAVALGATGAGAALVGFASFPVEALLGDGDESSGDDLEGA